MALKLKYTDEHGILHINMSPSSCSPKMEDAGNGNTTETSKTEITDPKFDTINNRFGQYDLFGGKYDVQGSDSSGDGVHRGSLFRSRYNSVEEELANTPYAFTTDKSVRLNNLNNNVFDITIKSRLDDASPSKDIEDDRFFNRNVDYDLFGPQIDFQTSINSEPPAFTVTQLIHAQDRYFDLSSRATVTDVKSDINSGSVDLKSEFEIRSAPNSARDARVVRIVDGKSSVVNQDEAFTVLAGKSVKAVQAVELTAKSQSAVPTSKRKRESSFAILAERPASPCSLPADTTPTHTRRSRGYAVTRTTPHTAANSQANSPVRRRRTSSLSRIDKMADTATLPPPVHTLLLSRPHSPPSPRDFVRENIEEVRELSEFNREMHEAEAEQRRLEEEEALLKEMGLLDKNAKLEGRRSVSGSKCNSRNASRSNSPGKIKLRSRSNSPSTILHYEIIPASKRDYVNSDDTVSKPVVHNSRMRSVSRSQPQSNNVSPKHSKIPKRQSSVSPTRDGNRWEPKRPVENKLNKNQRFISNSTSSINEAARIGAAVTDKRGMSKSQQHLSISPAHIKGKPPISPGRGGPPPSNRAINAKRLSPIVGTPNKSPVDGSKPGSARTPTKTSPSASKPVKTAGSTPATSRLNSRQPSRPASRDPSPEKGNRPSMRGTARFLSRVPSNRAGQNQNGTMNRSESNKSLNEDKSPVKRRDMRDKTIGISTMNTFMQGKKAPVPRRDFRDKTLGLSTMNSFMQGKKAPLPPKNNKDMKNKTLGISTMNSFMQGRKPQDKTPLNKNNSKNDLRNSTMSSIATLNTFVKGQKPPEKSPELTKKNSKVDLKEKTLSMSSVNSFMQGVKKDDTKPEGAPKSANKKETKDAETKYSSTESSTDEIMKQDIHTQVDNTITNEKGELVILTKKSIVSMTTAAITAQPLEIVTTVTNQLPTSLEKAREKGMFERHSSKDSILGKDTKAKEEVKTDAKEESKPLVEEKKATAGEKKNESVEEKNKKSAEENKNESAEEKKRDSAKPIKDMARLTTIFADDSVKLKPLQPPYNNPQVEKVKQKIDDILRSPEVSPQNILASTGEPAASKSKFKSMASKSGPKTDMTAKLMDMKSLVAKQIEKEEEAEMRTEATKIVDSIITPVEEPKPSTTDTKKEEVKTIETVVTVVNEKKSNGPKKELLKAMTAVALVKEEAEVEVQSSNVSTPVDKMEVQNKMADGASDASTHSNGGFPQSTSTTPRPPARAKHSAHSKNSSTNNEKPPAESKDESQDASSMKKPNICSRLMSKCAARCCPCCMKPDAEDMEKIAKVEEGRPGWMSKINCCKKKEVDVESTGRDAEAGIGKVSIDFENETKAKRKRKFRDVLCGCCGRSRRVSDASANVHDEPTGCCGRRRQVAERRDSILSDSPPTTCCDNSVFNWLRGACRRRSERGSRRNSMFSKNKSLSPTIPSEDNRPKLDPSLIEHSSTMRGAIPILPQALAYLCLVCNVIVPGLGTVFSGIFCLCFGIPRFGAHDGPRPRIGAFVMNLFVGAGQLFTVLFCLVGWGWSIWWGTIMIRVSRKYRRLKAEAEAAAAAEAAQAAPPVTTNNHARV